MDTGHNCNLCRVELDKLGVKKGDDVLLNDVSLHIHCGEVTALIGRNGAGKTTLLKALVGDLKHTGAVRHVSLDGGKSEGVVVGYVPQVLELDRSAPFSVLDFMVGALTNRPVWLWLDKTAKRRALQALEEQNAAHIANRRLGALSGGELQRVMLALALTPVPDLLLLDEPVSGVDQSGIELFYQKVKDLHKNRHMATLIVSHDFSMVARFAGRVVLLNRAVVCEGTPSEVFGSNEFSELYPNVSVREAAQ